MQRHQNLIPLSHQHHDALALCVMVERALQDDDSPENIARQAGKVMHFSATEGENHFELEENVLFPLIERTLGGHPLLQILRDEHAELRAMANQLADQPRRETLGAFTQLLRSHVRKEERELFEEIQNKLPLEAFDEAGLAMRSRAIQICITD